MCIALRSLVLVIVAIIVAGCASMPGAEPSSAYPASKAEREALEAAVAEFYDALTAVLRGEMGPMERIWSRSDDITYLSPSGRFDVGWDEVMADWRAQAQQGLGGMVRPSDIHLFLERGARIGVVQNFEHSAGSTIDGRQVDFTIRATNVFRKEGGRWLMVSHHTDIIPGLR